MGKRENRVDQYIANAKPFAKPILDHVRELIHETCPDVVEVMKWSAPHFEYKGEILCAIAGFKEHAAIRLWKAPLMDDPKRLLKDDGSAGNFGKILSMADLPPDKILVLFLKQAMKLNEAGVKVEKRIVKKEMNTDAPDYFMKALKKNKAALKTYEAFSPGNKRDYIVWITEAKSEATRNSRLATAIEWMAEGKTRMWKYKK